MNVVVVLVATLLSATWHLHSLLDVGSCFHPWVVVFFHRGCFTCGQSFVFVGSCFHLQVAVLICLQLWAVIYICGWLFAFVGGRFHCRLWLVVGAMLWLSSAVLLYGGCGG